MHIAWLGKKSPACGNVTYSREITNALLDRGHRVSFLHFAPESDSENADHEEFDENSQEAQDVALPFLYKSTIYTVPSLRANKILVDSLRSLKPDLVHASLAISPLDFRLPEICAELDLPLVATFHQPFDVKRRNLASSTQQLTYQIYAPSLADYNQVIIFSNIQKELLNKLGVPNTRIAIIPNGVDSDRYSPGPSNIKEELKADVLFLYQGRLAAEKNVEALLKAWRKCRMPKGCKLAIVGTGPLLAGLKAFYGNDPSIVWMGYIADEQRRIEILRGTDVFILPSLVEGLSLSLLEAMSCGVACIATDVGADGEVVEKGAGIILDSHKVTSQLCTLLPLFVDHPEMAKIIGIKARQRVLDRYTLVKNIDRLEVLYEQTMSQQWVRVSAF
ncbi:glycosyltransferase family 4 protein [Pseudanabaena sp. ABRG5-3]|jgi:glycosyltransferase involved in cell wall biosynthesis|uniref:glycosyltransferase family 4 protein n=1 Tax=Pseudanabaena sp. ABRG5-3 TaxID=685565 RepID=UPI000DC72D97|nr:glycosyltransferase family 4 protein [Pseudanabaena sp. ABRG5-3]BBC23592.1 DGDG synthase [Pseudanabaena sp. ABRG5-3]